MVLLMNSDSKAVVRSACMFYGELSKNNLHKEYNVGWFSWSFLGEFLKKKNLFVVAIFDLVHNVEAIHGLC